MHIRRVSVAYFAFQLHITWHQNDYIKRMAYIGTAINCTLDLPLLLAICNAF